MPLNPFKPNRMHKWAVEHPVGQALMFAAGGTWMAWVMLVFAGVLVGVAFWLVYGVACPVWLYFLYRPGGRGARWYKERTQSR